MPADRYEPSSSFCSSRQRRAVADGLLYPRFDNVARARRWFVFVGCAGRRFSELYPDGPDAVMRPMATTSVKVSVVVGTPTAAAEPSRLATRPSSSPGGRFPTARGHIACRRPLRYRQTRSGCQRRAVLFRLPGRHQSAQPRQSDRFPALPAMPCSVWCSSDTSRKCRRRFDVRQASFAGRGSDPR